MANAKTLRKRIALLAAAAVGVGMLVAAPASATTSGHFSWTTDVLSAGTPSQYVGGYAAVAFTPTATDTYTVSVNTGSIASESLGTAKIIGTATAATFPTTSFQFAGTVSTPETVTLTSAVAGVQTITVNELNASGTVINSYSQAVTWGSYTAATYAPGLSSLVLKNASSTVVTSLSAPMTPAQTLVGHVVATLNNSSNAAAVGLTVSATVSGPGLFNTGSGYARVASLTSTSGGVADFSIYSDGTAGVSTVTVSVTDAAGVTTTLGTQAITFYGNIATLTASQTLFVLAAGRPGTAATAITGTTAEGVNAVQLVAKDAAGVMVPLSGVTVTGTSSNTTVLSAGNQVVSTYNAGALNVDVLTASNTTSGKSATMTYSLTSGSGATISSAPVTFTIGGAVSKVVMSLDAATYTPGQAATLTFTATDASGNPVSDGSQVLSALGSNLSAQGLPTTFTTLTTSKGKATAALYAPATTGTWTLTATDINSVAVGSVSASVAAAADAAVAAAKAAADAATAAVATLSITVATLIASITAQLKALSVLVKKIMSKLKIR